MPKSPTFDPSETQHHFPNRFSIHQRLSGGHFFENDKKSIYPDLSRVQDSFTGGAALGSDFSVHSDVPCFSNVLLEKVKEPLRDGFSKCLRLQEKKSWSTRSGSLQSMGGSGIKRHTLSPKQLVCWGSSGLSRIGSCHEMILPYLTVSPTVSPSAL